MAMSTTASLVGALLSLVVKFNLGCTLSGQQEHLTLAQRLERADILVIGTVLGLGVDDKWYPSIPGYIERDMMFRVECVLKGDTTPVPPIIKVMYVLPMVSCEENSYSDLKPGTRLVQSLKRVPGSVIDFRWHLIGGKGKTVWNRQNTEVMGKVLSLPGLNVQLPEGKTNMVTCLRAVYAMKTEKKVGDPQVLDLLEP